MWNTGAAALGGLLGTVARYWLNAAIQERAGTLFPLGIFFVNVLGCFALGSLWPSYRCAAAVRTQRSS